MTGFFRYTINEDKWQIYLIDDDDNVIADEDAGAETDFEKQEMYFRKSDLTLEIVMHELFHVYFGYLYLRHTQDIELSDIEEIMAALFAAKAQRIIQRSEEIYKKLIELRNSNETESN